MHSQCVAMHEYFGHICRLITGAGQIPSWVTAERYLNGFGQFSGIKDKNKPWTFNFLFDVMRCLTILVNKADATFFC